MSECTPRCSEQHTYERGCGLMARTGPNLTVLLVFLVVVAMLLGAIVAGTYALVELQSMMGPTPQCETAA